MSGFSWQLERADFEQLLDSRPSLVRAFTRALCERIVLMNLLLEQREAGLAGPAGMRFGPYRVVEQLGAGGHAAVYSAVHVETGETAAVKVLPGAWGGASELRARLEQEAAALRRLAHPNIIHILDVGPVGTGLGGGLYLAMEWLPQALHRLMRAQYPEPLPLPMALRLAQGVATALAAVHAAGLVHRDVKPSNILLRHDGTPVLTDFGLVTGLAGEMIAQRLTPTNVILGTADYLSPEQVAGLPLDGRADLYSLGVVLYELVTGQVPFAGHDPLETLQAHVEAPPPPLPDSVPPAVQAIIARCLAKRAADRYASAAALASALADALAAG